MPEWILPPSFISLLAQFAPVFTKPSFASFRVVVVGWVFALGKHRISDVLRAAGPLVSKHYSAYYRFFSAGRWCLDELGLVLIAALLRAFRVEEVELVLDDTLSRRRGKKIALATMHADPLLRQGGRPFFSYGHVFVVLAVHVTTPLAKTGWALPMLFRLFEGRRRGGRKDAASDIKRRASRRRRDVVPRNRDRLTDRAVVRGKLVETEPRKDSGPPADEYRPTKLQLAAEMVLLVARRFPGVRFRVLADHAYNGRALLHEVASQVNNVTFVVRGHGNAALYALPPEATGRRGRGRPRTRGERLPTPEDWAKNRRRAFKRVEVDMYGESVPLLVASFVGMAYRTLPGRLVRYVIVKDPRGVYQTQYLMTTDTEISEADVVTAYSHRWPLELAFQETKQKLGMQDPQTQLPASVRRTAPMAMLTYSLVVFWYVTDGHREASRLRVQRVPWYDKTGRPAFSDMLAALRRLGWRQGFLDPARRRTKKQKMLEAYLDNVAAAA